jgi:hypothetical protein
MYNVRSQPREKSRRIEMNSLPGHGGNLKADYKNI